MTYRQQNPPPQELRDERRRRRYSREQASATHAASPYFRCFEVQTAVMRCLRIYYHCTYYTAAITEVATLLRLFFYAQLAGVDRHYFLRIDDEILHGLLDLPC